MIGLDVPSIAQGVNAFIDEHRGASVPGLDEAAFGQFAVQAKESCTVSRALAGVQRISVSVALLGATHR